jgi:hypothetical protein
MGDTHDATRPTARFAKGLADVVAASTAPTPTVDVVLPAWVSIEER